MKRPIVVRLVFLAVMAVLAGAANARQPETVFDSDLWESDLWPLDLEIALDSTIIHGVLDNGLSYYVRTNSWPENRAELRLGVKVGSVQEGPDQLGLAHFIQHMAFNGTNLFRKHELTQFFEAIGMRFGPDVSAYTRFDETAYQLSIPLDDPVIAEQAMLILREWAGGIVFDPEELDKERAVIVEEWRVGGGAGSRMRAQQLPVLLAGSRYAERMPIGDIDQIQGFVREDLLAFYNDWYRPELMSVVAVGDFDAEWMEGLIKAFFTTLRNPEDAPEWAQYPVPTNEDTLVVVAQDREATVSMANIYYKHPVVDEITVADYRLMMIHRLHNAMLNRRLQETSQQLDPPFLYAQAGYDEVVRTKAVFSLSAVVPDDGVHRGLDGLMTEAARVLEHGFTQSELERAKSELLGFMESLNREGDRVESRLFAEEYLRNFFEAEFVPGIKMEYDLHQLYLPGISVAEVNRLAREWIRPEGRVVTVSGPSKPGVTYPSEQEIVAVVDQAERRQVAGYVDDVVDEPLMETAPTPGRITQEKHFEELGVTEWTLSNGITVVVKPTDFRSGELRFRAWSPGGTSLVSDTDYVAAATAASVVREGGAGKFSASQLDKLLAGRRVTVAPFIDELSEGFSGGAPTVNLEAMLQLMHLYATEPARNPDSFQALKARLIGLRGNRLSQPDAVFSETLQALLYGDSVRAGALSAEDLRLMDLDKSLAIYRDRFADLGDAVFVFVGDLELESLRPLVEDYVASLPFEGREETWDPVDLGLPGVVAEATVTMGREPGSSVALAFHGKYRWSLENNFALDALVNLLRIRLREVLREYLIGTAGVGVWADTRRYPEEQYVLNVSFSTAAGRVDDAVRAAFTELDWLKFLAEEDLVVRVREGLRRRRETEMMSNDFWLRELRDAYFHGVPLEDAFAYSALLEGLTPKLIEETARELIDFRRYVRVVLTPETGE